MPAGIKPGTQIAFSLSSFNAAVILDCVIHRMRWYMARHCQYPEHLWGAFFTLCTQLKLDPHVVEKRELDSRNGQVFRA